MAVNINIARSSSSYVIGSIDDLLMQILLCLPVKSLIRFKLVSKHWKSLITNLHYSHLPYRGRNRVVGLICSRRDSSLFEYVNLDVDNLIKPPFKELRFPGDALSYSIRQSCNGLLLLCCSSRYIECCYVLNPTTKCFTKLLPRPCVRMSRIVHGVNMAFDPAKSPFYEVVCVMGSKEFAPDHFQIEIYSSESRVWRVCGEPFSATAKFDYGVYWNGSIHWISNRAKEILYFNVNEGSLKNVLLPDTISGCGKDIRRSIAYFGESCDHLHVVEGCDDLMGFDVYEMKRDYSEWFVKYRIDLRIAADFLASMPNSVELMCSSFSGLAEAACHEKTNNNDLAKKTYFRFCVLSLVRVEEEEGSFLVLYASGKAIRLNLYCNAYHYYASNVMSSVGDIVVPRASRDFQQIYRSFAFEHIESLSGV